MGWAGDVHTIIEKRNQEFSLAKAFYTIAI
jgi:hypothetical protein